MRLRMIIALVAVVATVLVGRGCSERKDGAAMKIQTADNAAADDESQSADFSLSAKNDEGFDLPEREEIRQKRKLTPGTKVFVIGLNDARVDSDGKEVFVMGVNGPVKVETADTERGWWWASLKARIGNGGSVIEVHDVNGNVTLSKAVKRDGETARRRDSEAER